MSGDSLVLSAGERDLVYEQSVARFVAGLPDQVWGAISEERWDDARPVAVELSDLLRLVSQDLGWGDHDASAVELTIPADVRRRSAAHLDEIGHQLLLRSSGEHAMDPAPPASPDQASSMTVPGRERDEMFEAIVNKLSGLDEITRRIQAEEWRGLGELSFEISDLLCIVNDGLGWGHWLEEEAVMKVPDDVLRRALPTLSTWVDYDIAHFTQEAAEATGQVQGALCVKSACRRLLAVLEDNPADFAAHAQYQAG